MELELLLSTMNLKNKEANQKLLERMNVKNISTLTINQITKNGIECENDIEAGNRIISVEEKGLSKSRNKAIQNANGDICIFSDDDIIYENDFTETIKKAYEDNPKYDIICFYVQSSGDRKIKRMITSPVGKLRTMKICSVEITFKKEKIIENGIKFNENFGAGTYYDRGEETIFLWDCIRKGLKIKFINKKIAKVDYEKSTWFKGFDKEFLAKQGRVMYELSPKYYKILVLQFAIRKYHLYRKNVGLIQAIKAMEAEISKAKQNI